MYQVSDDPIEDRNDFFFNRVVTNTSLSVTHFLHLFFVERIRWKVLYSNVIV